MAREQRTQPKKRDDSLLGRRSYLKLAGGAAAVVATSTSVTAQSNERTLNVNDGEVIDPYLQSISDGETVRIPSGTYKYNGTTISASDWTLDGQGCTFVPQGYARLRLSGDGWQFGHVRFDTTDGNNLTVLPEGGDWRFHNCAWDGPNTGRETVDFLFAPEVDSGTTAVADSIWWGGGLGSNTTESAVKHLGGVDGEMRYERCFFRQNGTYATETAESNRSEGVAHFENCYAENCWHGAFRLGNDYGETGTVRNCTVVYDDADEAMTTNVRGIWTFWGDVLVENTDISCNFGQAIATSDRTSTPAHQSGTVQVEGGNIDGPIQNRVETSNVGSDPSKTPPSGCPTTVSEAVNGTSDDTSGGSGDSGGSDDGSNDTETPSDSELPHTLSIVGDGSEVVHYEFTVTDQIRKSTARNATKDSEDEINQQTVSGAVAGGTDSYEFAGKVSSFTIDGKATIYLDGSTVAADEVAQPTDGTDDEPTDGTDGGSDGGTDGGETYAGKLIIDGSETPNQASRYRFAVSGDVKKDGLLGSLNPFDTISDGEVAGRVVGGKDAYRIDGEVTGFQIDGRATIQYVEE